MSFVDDLVQLPALPIRLPLATRLADDLRAAVGHAALDPRTLGALETALRQVMNGWTLSVSRFLCVEDEVETLLTDAHVGRPLVDAVLTDLEDVFLSLWDRSTPASIPPTLGAVLRPVAVRR